MIQISQAKMSTHPIWNFFKCNNIWAVVNKVFNRLYSILEMITKWDWQSAKSFSVNSTIVFRVLKINIIVETNVFTIAATYLIKIFYKNLCVDIDLTCLNNSF